MLQKTEITAVCGPVVPKSLNVTFPYCIEICIFKRESKRVFGNESEAWPVVCAERQTLVVHPFCHKATIWSD